MLFSMLRVLNKDPVLAVLADCSPPPPPEVVVLSWILWYGCFALLEIVCYYCYCCRRF